MNDNNSQQGKRTWGVSPVSAVLFFRQSVSVVQIPVIVGYERHIPEREERVVQASKLKGKQLFFRKMAWYLLFAKPFFLILILWCQLDMACWKPFIWETKHVPCQKLSVFIFYFLTIYWFGKESEISAIIFSFIIFPEIFHKGIKYINVPELIPDRVNKITHYVVFLMTTTRLQTKHEYLCLFKLKYTI